MIGTVSHKTHLIPEWPKSTSSRFLKRSKGLSLKKLSKEFNRTESRFLGALSKLDEFLLNPQVRTCSVAVPGTSRNNDPENRELIGDRSLGDPYPEAVFSSCHSSNLNDSEQDETHHRNSSDWDGKTNLLEKKMNFFSSEKNLLFLGRRGNCKRLIQ